VADDLVVGAELALQDLSDDLRDLRGFHDALEYAGGGESERNIFLDSRDRWSRTGLARTRIRA
jgi:hypothetical protein